MQRLIACAAVFAGLVATLLAGPETNVKSHLLINH